MTDKDALEELRAEIERNNPQFDLVTVSRTLCLSKLAAWEKERAYWDTLVDKWDNRLDQLAALRAAVEKVRDELHDVREKLREATRRGYANQTDAVECERGLSMVMDALDAALRGGA